MNLGLTRVVAGLAFATRVLAVTSLISLCFVVLLNVTMRYLFGVALVWTFEVAQLLILWVAFTGSALAFYAREGGHLQVRWFMNKVSRPVRTAIQLFCNVVVLGVLLVILNGAIQRSPSAWEQSRGIVDWLSFGWFYLALLVGTGLSIVFVIAWTLDIALRGSRPVEGD